MGAPGDDAGSGDACSSDGEGMLEVAVVIPEGVPADVHVTRMGEPVEGSPFASGTTLTLPAGEYEVSAGRVHTAGDIVGAAYQPSVELGTLCVRDGESTTATVTYTLEPGSQKLWATNANGEGQILAFDAADLSAAGAQEPDVTLDGKLTSASALRVDAQGRLWVGDTTGKLVAFDTARLGASSTTGPDIVLDGPALCGETLPCGPRALAFDAEGNLWVALLDRVIKLSKESLDASGQPAAAVTITSPDAANPISLAFDADGSLWVGEYDTSGVAKFAAARLAADITNGAADVVIHGEQGPPVVIGLGMPDGLVFDPDGNLWVGYWSANQLARYTPEELGATATLTPTVLFDIGATALMTDLAIDESGNLWMPGVMGTLARIDADQLSEAEPMVTVLESAAIGSAEKIALHSVAGPLFIAP